jgi:aldehyde:ferredoxin oxidoreductase
MKAGERGTTMARVFNLKEGLGRKDDTIPERFYEPIPSGPLKGEKINRKEFVDAISLYYAMMGWDSENGVPTRGRLEELELGWLWNDIKQLSTP